MDSYNAMKRSIFRTCDCPCSSLAINCCQFGCCIANVPVVDFDSSTSLSSLQNANWMTKLTNMNPTITLRQMMIPGSHDSASYTITKMKPFSASGRTQNITIYEQLLFYGCRYLDIRVGGGSSNSSNDVNIFHGCLKGCKLENVINEICTFLKQYPGEFLIIEIVAEYGQSFTSKQKRYCLDILRTELDSFVYTDNDPNKLYNQTTLKTLTQTLKKQVLILLHPRIYKDFVCEDNGQVYDEHYIAETYGFFSSHHWMRNRWHNTRNIQQLLEGNLMDVQKYTNDRNSLLTSQFVLTPGVGSIQDALQLLLGTLSLRPVSFAYKLYQQDKLDNFMRSHSNESWNIVMMDFVDLAPAFISFLIGLNFPSSLELMNVTVKQHHHHEEESSSLNVTDKAKKFLCRNNKMLYLTNIQQDLELPFENGIITIQYKIGDEQQHQTLVPFNVATEILVGEYTNASQNGEGENNFVHLDTEFTGVAASME